MKDKRNPRVKKMEKEVRGYHKDRYPEKRLRHILIRIEEKFGLFGHLVAIRMIKRNQWDELSQEEQCSILEEERVLLQKRPELEEQTKEVEDCTSR